MPRLSEFIEIPTIYPDFDGVGVIEQEPIRLVGIQVSRQGNVQIDLGPAIPKELRTSFPRGPRLIFDGSGVLVKGSLLDLTSRYPDIRDNVLVTLDRFETVAPKHNYRYDQNKQRVDELLHEVRDLFSGRSSLVPDRLGDGVSNNRLGSRYVAGKEASQNLK